MGRNVSGGKHAKRQKNHRDERSEAEPEPGDGAEFAMVLRALGQCRFAAVFLDGKERIVTVRGSMRKRMYIRANDIILASKREFESEDARGDVLYKYSEGYLMRLRKRMPDLPFWKKRGFEGGSVEDDDDDDEVAFVEDSGAEESESESESEARSTEDESAQSDSDSEASIDIDAI